MNSTKRRLMLAAASLLVVAGAHAQQDYPSRPISIYVGGAAGSGSDQLVRYLADKLRTLSGQSVIVENRPGVFGNLAATAVAKAKPDGYSILVAPNITFAVSSYMFKNLQYHPVKDFLPVGTISQGPFFLVVDAQKGPKTVAELTQRLRAKGDKASYGAPNGISLAAAELYKSIAGVKAAQIPYKSVSQAMIEMSMGQLDFVFVDAPSVLSTDGGKFRPIAVTTEKRSSAATEVPTMIEAGVPGFPQVSAWFGMALPAGTPTPIADKLNGWLTRILAMEDTAKFLRMRGQEPFPGSPKAMAAYQAAELENWGRIARITKLEPQ